MTRHVYEGISLQTWNSCVAATCLAWRVVCGGFNVGTHGPASLVSPPHASHEGLSVGVSLWVLIDRPFLRRRHIPRMGVCLWGFHCGYSRAGQSCVAATCLAWGFVCGVFTVIIHGPASPTSLPHASHGVCLGGFHCGYSWTSQSCVVATCLAWAFVCGFIKRP